MQIYKVIISINLRKYNQFFIEKTLFNFANTNTFAISKFCSNRLFCFYTMRFLLSTVEETIFSLLVYLKSYKIAEIVVKNVSPLPIYVLMRLKLKKS